MLNGVNSWIDIRRAISTHADQCSLAISKVIFNNQAVVIVNIHYEIITVTYSIDYRWTTSTGCIDKFVIDIIYRFNL